MAAALKRDGHVSSSRRTRSSRLRSRRESIVIEAGSGCGLSAAEEASQHGIPERDRAPADRGAIHFSAVFRVRSMVAYAIHKFFQDKNFVYVHTPIITASDCEGAGEMFKVTTLDLDDLPKDAEGKDRLQSRTSSAKEAGLTVSGQLEAETFALAFRNVYTFGPTFRAENSNTARHASEFWMIEPEMAFADLDRQYGCGRGDDKVHHKLRAGKCVLEEMEFFSKFIDKGLIERLNNIVNSDFARITYTEAVELLQKSGEKFQYPVEWGIDLQTEHETIHH